MIRLESKSGISINQLSRQLGLGASTIVRETRDIVPPINTSITKKGARIGPGEIPRIIKHLKEHGVAVRDPQASH